MRIHDLLNESTTGLTTLVQQCSQFLEEAEGHAVLKNLPCHYSDFHKVKVRKRKAEVFDQTFNVAFNEYHELRQRSIFGNGTATFIAEGVSQDPFYIFPIDGYKFMYCNEVKNSKAEYEQVFDSIIEGFGHDKGNQVIADVLKFTYMSDHLAEGITSGAEIIFYNTPFYYAVRANVDYDSLLTDLTEYSNLAHEKK